MATVDIRFYGALRKSLPTHRTRLEVPSIFTLSDLAEALAMQFGEFARDLILNQSGFARTYAQVYVGGVEASGSPRERFGPFPDGWPPIEVLVVPMLDGC